MLTQITPVPATVVSITFSEQQIVPAPRSPNLLRFPVYEPEHAFRTHS
jgi:hypothetical protein